MSRFSSLTLRSRVSIIHAVNSTSRGALGFTLIELLVVISILGILLAFLAPIIVGRVTTNARRTATMEEMRMLRDAIAGNPDVTVGGEMVSTGFKNDIGRWPRDLVEPHLIWPASVFATVIEAAIAQKRYGLARAIAIARFAGARRGDLVRIPRTARAGGRFQFRSGKRGVAVDVPEDPELTRWLDGTPSSQPPSPWRM